MPLDAAFAVVAARRITSTRRSTSWREHKDAVEQALRNRTQELFALLLDLVLPTTLFEDLHAALGARLEKSRLNSVHKWTGPNGARNCPKDQGLGPGGGVPSAQPTLRYS